MEGLTHQQYSSQTATTNFEQFISACENGETFEMAQFDMTQLEDACDTIDLWLMFEADCSSVRGAAPVWNCTLCGFQNRVQNRIAYTPRYKVVEEAELCSSRIATCQLLASSKPSILPK